MTLGEAFRRIQADRGDVAAWLRIEEASRRITKAMASDFDCAVRFGGISVIEEVDGKVFMKTLRRLGALIPTEPAGGPEKPPAETAPADEPQPSEGEDAEDGDEDGENGDADEPIENPRAFLRKTVRNAWLDAVRKYCPRPPKPAPEPPKPAPEPPTAVTASGEGKDEGNASNEGGATKKKKEKTSNKPSRTACDEVLQQPRNVDRLLALATSIFASPGKADPQDLVRDLDHVVALAFSGATVEELVAEGGADPEDDEAWGKAVLRFYQRRSRFLKRLEKAVDKADPLDRDLLLQLVRCLKWCQTRRAPPSRDAEDQEPGGNP